MSFFDNYQFFCVLILILLPALLLGILEQPLKWYSTAATILFTALAFFSKPEQAAYLILFFIIELTVVKGYMALRVSRDRNVRVYRLALFLSILPLILSKLAGLWGESIFAFLLCKNAADKIVGIVSFLELKEEIHLIFDINVRY